MKHFETNWKSTDNLNIYAQGWEPEKKSVKAAVCLVHGLGEHTSRYTHVAEAFTDGGIALMGADLRGHGRSDGKHGHFPSIELVMQDMDILLKQVRKRYPELPLFLFGHSLGGLLVLHYGLKRNPKLHGIIASGSALRIDIENHSATVFLAKILGTLFPELSVPNGLNADDISRNKKVVQDYKKDPLIRHKITLGFGKIMLAVAKWTLEHAGEFSLPLLLMHGKADKMTFPSGSTDFAASLNDKCKLVLWENAWHELHNEPQRAEVIEAMMNWIDSRLTSAHAD